MAYNSILLLKDLLEKEEIPFDFDELFGGYHICYPSKESRICSVVEHDYSYGNTSDLLEIRGLLTKKETEEDDVAGYLTALDVYDRIKTHWNKVKPLWRRYAIYERQKNATNHR